MSSTALNPFVVGSAISDSAGRGFFGREKVFSFVRSALNSVYRPPILLLGQRRIGKSSVLRQLPAHLPADYHCIYFDLQGKGQMNLEGVLFGLAREIAAGLKIAKPDRNQATETAFDQFLQSAFDALDGHRERLVLLFDEFDVVDESTAKRSDTAVNLFIPWLAELIRRYPQVGYIFVVGRKTEELSGNLNGTLLKDSVQRPIGRLEKEEVASLIRDSSGSILAFDDAAVQRAYQLTAGHPFCAQVLCHVIWDYSVRKSNSLLVAVTQEDVDACIPETLELGANGMNWIFDGLTDPIHRLVLAAIAQESDPSASKGVDRSGIDAALRRRSVRLDALEIDRAVRDLQGWDVLEKSGPGFQFCVPLIGLWTKQRRPLESLERDVRFANPRAWRFYELAIDSRAQGNIDQAIDEFRDALRENPTFAEAQRGLASCLFQRGRPSETAQIIESLERAHDLDPSGPTTELLEALTKGVSSTANIASVKARLNRIRELDPGGPFESRAVRAIAEHARQLVENRGSIKASAAASLYTLIGDDLEAAREQELARIYDRENSLSVLAFLVFTVAIFATGYLPLPKVVPWLRLAMALGGGTGAAFVMHAGEPKRARPIWLVLSSVCVAAVCVLSMYLWRPGNIVYFIAYFAPIVICGIISPISYGTLLPEDQAPADTDRDPFSRLTNAMRYLFRGTLPRPHGKEGESP